jgi:hypothetical protein
MSTFQKWLRADSVVSIMIRLVAGNLWSCGSIPGSGLRFFFNRNQFSSRPHPASCVVSTRRSFSRGKLTAHFLLLLRTRISGAIPSNPICFRGMYWDFITFTSNLSKQICVWSRYAHKVLLDEGRNEQRIFTIAVAGSYLLSLFVFLLPLPPSGFHSASLYSWSNVRIHWVAGNRMEELTLNTCVYFFSVLIVFLVVCTLFTSRNNEPCWF